MVVKGLRTTLLSCLVLLAGLAVARAQQTPIGADSLAIIGEPRGRPVSGEELTHRTEELTDRMRCPVCQGLSIAASDTMIALAMKEEVRQFLGAGYTEEQILGYFEASYGEFIRLEPKPTGFNLVVWIAPAVVLLLGFGIVVYRYRSGSRIRASVAASPADTDAAALEAYRDRVRREVSS